jgi:hypothetical protein
VCTAARVTQPAPWTSSTLSVAKRGSLPESDPPAPRELEPVQVSPILVR